MDVSPSGRGIIKVNRSAASSYPATFEFTDGALILLEAVPTAGYAFKSWGGDLSGTINPTTVMVDCNKQVTAIFSPTMHTLTMQVNGSGSTSPVVGHHSYTSGTVISVASIPDAGWRFDGWTGDVADPSSAITTIIVDSDKALVANFSQVTPNWWLIGGIITGVPIIGVIIWFTTKRRIFSLASHRP